MQASVSYLVSFYCPAAFSPVSPRSSTSVDGPGVSLGHRQSAGVRRWLRLPDPVGYEVPSAFWQGPFENGYPKFGVDLIRLSGRLYCYEIKKRTLGFSPFRNRDNNSVGGKHTDANSFSGCRSPFVQHNARCRSPYPPCITFKGSLGRESPVIRKRVGIALLPRQYIRHITLNYPQVIFKRVCRRRDHTRRKTSIMRPHSHTYFT
jgi:hypothetical protein